MNFRSLAGAALALSLLHSMGVARAQILDFSCPLNVGPLNPHDYGGNHSEDGSVAPWLAKSWTPPDDGKTYTFKLRPKVDEAALRRELDACLIPACQFTPEAWARALPSWQAA
jgi:nickel transport system substrate-binding protein